MTLLEMMRQDFDVRMPQLEGALPKDDSGVNVSSILETVRKAIRDVPGFEVVEEVVLSTFSFAKYLMWRDLADRTDSLKESPFVAHVIDHPRDPYGHSANFLRPNEIDEKIDPSELFMPLHADSSQIVAVHASSNTGDFVLEGPPGTGKSQTIANIIAHNLGLGRRVLFISEKMAALEVVFRRLREKGLGDFCLELHSNKANKRTVLDQLGSSWRNRQAHNPSEWKLQAARLKQLRDELNGLVKALHKPGATGISPRSAIGRAVRWRELHRFRLDWEGGLDVDPAKDEAGRRRLEDIAARSQIPVWDAIGAIARGRNAIIVGDPKQMPPTSFFDRAASADDDDEGGGTSDDLESILDEALASSIKLHRLTGHYRSRHESLIAFSNHRYYGGDLVTYPSCETRTTAVSFVKVEGIYQRGAGRTNPDEAKAVVCEVVRRLSDQELCKLSIGVVALNSEQQRLIDDLLDQERRKNPDLEEFFGDNAEEPVFVKNLETVQGDQRDVILLSIGYPHNRICRRLTPKKPDSHVTYTLRGAP